jgi:hypothetical protein
MADTTGRNFNAHRVRARLWDIALHELKRAIGSGHLHGAHFGHKILRLFVCKSKANLFGKKRWTNGASLLLRSTVSAPSVATARTTMVVATAAVGANRGGFKVRYDAASRRPPQALIVAQRKAGELFAEIVDRRFSFATAIP